MFPPNWVLALSVSSPVMSRLQGVACAGMCRTAAASCLPTNPDLVCSGRTGTAKAEWKRAGADPPQDRRADPGRSGGARRLLPGLRALGRGRAQACRNPGTAEDARRLRAALAMARD